MLVRNTMIILRGFRFIEQDIFIILWKRNIEITYLASNWQYFY